MGRLIDDLLLLARSDGSAPNGAQNGQAPQPVALQMIAADGVRSAAGLASGQEVSVVAPVPVTVQGDPDRLKQLLLILLDNALRHTPAGRQVSVEVVPPVGGVAKLVVRDEGEGIAPEHLPHVFDRFYRADGARGRATGGTGLGLAIARVIARAHGGEITVRSEPGRGSEFEVSLPVDSTRPA
jgi:signal transduction histidine kinase